MKSFVGEPIDFGGPVFINPGSGPVNGATVASAKENIQQLIIDVGLNPVEVKVKRHPKDDDNGRFAFTLHYQGRTCEVDMPGLSLAEVRYMDKDTQNIWDFPRLYIDGSSWVWLYAIRAAKGSLIKQEDEQ